MKKINYAFLYFTLLFYLTSCASPKLSPAIIFNNSSPDNSIVKNIKVNWNGYNLVGISGPINICGGGGNQSFFLEKESDLFGMIRVQWENAKGEKLKKDFIFTRENMPNYNKRHTEVVFYFGQTDVEYYTSDKFNLMKIEKEKRGNWVNKWFEKEQKHKCVYDPKERKRIEEVSKKYPNISTKTGKPVEEEEDLW